MYVVPPAPCASCVQEYVHGTPLTNPPSGTSTSVVQPLQMPVDLLVLFQEEESGHRVRAQPHKAGHPAPEHPPNAFTLDRPAQQPEQALRLLGAHDARLDHVDGTADGGRDEAREQGGGKVRRQVVVERGVGQQGALEAVVAGELAGRHEHGAHAVGPHAPPEAPPAFLSRHAEEAVDGVFVVASLVGGEGGVVLHADVEHVGGVAGDAAEEAGGAGHGNEGGEGGGGAGGREGFFELGVDAEAGGGVG